MARNARSGRVQLDRRLGAAQVHHRKEHPHSIRRPAPHQAHLRGQDLLLPSFQRDHADRAQVAG